MITWNNLDTLEAFKNLSKAERVNIAEAMSRERSRKSKELQRSDGRGTYL